MAELERSRWDDIDWEVVNPKMKRKIITGDNLTIAKIKFENGFVVPQHAHVNEQITQVLEGRMHFWFGENGETEMILDPGDSVVIPSNLPHKALMIGEVLEIDTWAPRRDDWLDKSDDYLRG